MPVTRGPGVLALLAATACGAGGGEVQLRLSLDQGSCGEVTPGELPLPCGGAVGLWVIEVGGAAVAERCVGFAPDHTWLSEVPSILSDAGVSLDLDPGGEVVVELAIFGPGTFGCPRWTGGEDQMPLHFARSEPVKLSGPRPEIELSLECLIRPDGCGGDGSVAASAAILDLERLLQPAGDQVLGVAIGAVFAAGSHEEDGSPDDMEREARLEELGALAGSGGAWAGTIAAIPAGSTCVATLMSSADGLEFLSCQASPADAGALDELMTTAYVTSLNDFADPGGGLSESLVAQGVIYGRVIGAPGSQGVGEVVALDPGYTVHVDGDRFLAWRVNGATPHCCVRFAAVTEGDNDGESIVSDPVPVFPGVVTTLVLTGP